MLEMLLDEDPLTGTRRIMHRDEYDRTNTIVEEQKVDGIVELNKEQYKEAGGRWEETFNKVASIPIVLYFKLKKEGIIDDPARLKRWLNDSDNRVFRTRPGRV
jgi:hypothetical protein